MQTSYSPTKRLALSGISSTYYALATPNKLSNNPAQVLSESTKNKLHKLKLSARLWSRIRN